MRYEHLVVGLGEVGSALREVLDGSGHDPAKGVRAEPGPWGFLHICFPHGPGEEGAEKFRKDVMTAYTDLVRSSNVIIVIHSTVPLGTSAALGSVASPVRGLHPNLVQGLKTFEKLVAHHRPSVVTAVAMAFEKVGIPVRCIPTTRDAEAAKLWETAQYGAFILLEKEIYEYCTKHGLSFHEVYTRFNASYNAGYTTLGYPEYHRPVLKHVPGEIGGHCVVPNAAFLDSPTAKRIRGEA